MKKILIAASLALFLATVLPGYGLAQPLDFGDAPEGTLAYPSMGVMGMFPTCITVGPATWIQHTNFGAWFGPAVDFEPDGNAGLCPPSGFPPYDQDECFADGDAGLLVPQAYTIDPTPAVVPCPLGQAPPALGQTCQTAAWGVNVDIELHNHMPSATTGYLNVLMDWNQDGIWGGSSPCPPMGTPAPEHVLVNFFPVPNPFDGPLSALMPPGFLIGPNSGFVWTRFTITEKPVLLPWDGSGSFEDGESEDYLILINPDVEPTIFPEEPTRCPVIQTHCPADPTFCPIIDTQCPADPIATICPEEATRCPVVETECPTLATACPSGIPTWCPIDPTFCPKDPPYCPPDEFTIWPELMTQCPVIFTACPQGPTLCPDHPTACPGADTWCPEIPTQCPIDPVFTFCPLNETQCPADPTNCPLDWTFCPDIPTVCPDILTVCPEIITTCPATPTLCETTVPTVCPTDPTNCPVVLTTCPINPTTCPSGPTFCSTVDTDGDGVDDCNDNCPNHPNGPLQGTCTRVAGVNRIVSTGPPFCTVDADCGPGKFCEKIQADTYPPGGNGIGDACECEGNFDCDVDTSVDADDVSAFLADFGRSIFFNPCSTAAPCNGDFLCDGDVDADDVTKFLEDFGRSQFNKPCPSCPTGVPWCTYGP